MEPIIEIKNLSQVYSPHTPYELRALDDVNLQIMPGECLGIIGKTGSGKSTFIQHLNGLMQPTSGQVLFEGQDIWSSKEVARQVRFSVGLVFQYAEYQLFEETVYKDIAYGPKNMQLDEAEIDRRVHEAAAFAGVPEEMLELSPFEISGGQKRRVAIAGVIAMEPKVLVLDEPAAGLDPAGTAEIFANIEQYRKAKGATVIIVSHSMEEVSRIADRLAVIDSGKLPYVGTPLEIFAHGSELESMGLTVPAMTRVFTELHKKGYAVDPFVYTIDQAKAEILKALHREAD